MPEPQRQLAAIMFTDIVGYSKLMGTNESKALALLSRNRQLHKEIIEKHRGRWLKEIGDGTLSSFNSVTDATLCAIELQEQTSLDEDLSLGIGLHQGEIVFEDNDVFGDGVNIASRVGDLADKGQIIATENVYQNIKNKEGIYSNFLREESLKNISDPVRIYQISKAESPTEPKAPKSDHEGRLVLSKRGMLVGVFLVVTAVVFMVWKLMDLNGADTETNLSQFRIAVLPYENKSNDESLDELGFMAADWIVSGLSNLDNVRVTQSATVKEHLAALGDLNVFANRVGAERIIRGNLYKQNNNIYFSSQVVDPQSGDVILILPEIKGSQDDIEGLVDELRQRIVSAIFANEEYSYDLPKTNPPKYDAYQYMVKSNELFAIDYDRSREMANEAIAIDSTYYAPYQLIIFGYGNTGDYESADSVFKLVDKLYHRLTPYEKLWHDFMKVNQDGGIPETIDAIKKIYDKDPREMLTNYLMGLHYAQNNMPGRAVESFSAIKPENINYTVPWYTWWNDRYSESLAKLGQFDKALEILSYVPDNLKTQRTFRNLAWINILMKDSDPIQPVLDSMRIIGRSTEDLVYVMGWATRYFVTTGDKDNYEALRNDLSDFLLENEDNLSTYWNAFGNFSIQNYDKAIYYYERAVNDPDISRGLKLQRMSYLGCAYALSGNQNKAFEIIDMLLEEPLHPSLDGTIYYGIGTIYACLGEAEKSVENLKRAFEYGSGFGTQNYDWDFRLTSLIGYQPFDEFVRPKD